ncbi:MAG: MaoC/PaaZ C-terminal domain-containing protein [Bacteroidia bacterium]|nr:MaoC/PaaZ C-terminal domain-containing protein [Bacteroidia bacterium]
MFINNPDWKIPSSELVEGKWYQFPSIRLSEDEIIAFAKEMDPQPIHIDPVAAAQSRFGRIIASGLHVYICFHKRWWVNAVQDHFICGLSIDGTKFFAPVYADLDVVGKLSIQKIEPHPQKPQAAITWRWDFFTLEEKPLLHLHCQSLHHWNNLHHEQTRSSISSNERRN